MNAEQMFKDFALQKGLTGAGFTAWQFSDQPDELARLVLLGIKTATASVYQLYEPDQEPLPKAEDYSVILNSNDEAQCIIRTSKVDYVPFKDVSADHAFKEGEGDCSLDTWRQIHQRVFTQWLQRHDLVFDDNLIVVCEEFNLVYPEKSMCNSLTQ